MSASLFKAELTGGAQALVYVELNADNDVGVLVRWPFTIGYIARI